MKVPTSIWVMARFVEEASEVFGHSFFDTTTLRGLPSEFGPLLRRRLMNVGKQIATVQSQVTPYLDPFGFTQTETGFKAFSSFRFKYRGHISEGNSAVYMVYITTYWSINLVI